MVKRYSVRVITGQYGHPQAELYRDDKGPVVDRADHDAEVARLREVLAKGAAIMRDCADHFATLRAANVFVWPHHPMNPETRISEWLAFLRTEGL